MKLSTNSVRPKIYKIKVEISEANLIAAHLAESDAVEGLEEQGSHLGPVGLLRIKGLVLVDAGGRQGGDAHAVADEEDDVLGHVGVDAGHAVEALLHRGAVLLVPVRHACKVEHDMHGWYETVLADLHGLRCLKSYSKNTL